MHSISKQILAFVLAVLSICAPVMPAAAQQPTSAGVAQYTSTVTDCSRPQYIGATWNVTLANCIAGTSTHDGNVWDMQNVRGTQTIAANPTAALVGTGGFAPAKSGTVLVGAGNYTMDQDLVLTGGLDFECPSGVHQGGAAATMGCNLFLNMPSRYTTGQVTNTAATCPGAPSPCTMTFTGIGTSWVANQVYEQIMVCLSALPCPGGESATSGAAEAQGMIQSINTVAQTMTVLVNRTNIEGNANATAVNYQIFPTGIAFGDGSCATASNTCSNFGVRMGGFTVDAITNAVSGAWLFFNRSASNQSGFTHANAWLPYDGGCFYIGGPGAQNSTFVSPDSQWCSSNTLGGNTTQHTAQGLVVRSTGAPPSWIANMQISLAGAQNSTTVTGIDTCDFCIGSTVLLGPSVKAITSNYASNTTSWGWQYNAGITCSAACEDLEGNASGSTLIGAVSASIGAGAVQLSNVTAQMANFNLFTLLDDNSPASGIPYLVQDLGNSVNVPYNDTSLANNTLGYYQLDANGKSHTSAGCTGCNTYQLALANLPALFQTNAQTATYQLLAADFAGYKVIPVSSGTFTITVVASTSQPTSGQGVWVINYGSGVVTIARSGQNLNGGTASVPIPPGSQASPSAAYIISDGTNYEVTVYDSLSLPGVDSGSANAYVVTGTAITQLAASGTIGCFKAANASTTTTPTVNFNSLGAKTIVRFNGGALAVGDIGTSEPVCMVYDGTNMLLLNPQGTTGSGTYVLSNAPTITGQTSLANIKIDNLLLNNTAPTVSSGFGTSPSIASNNGTASFTINVGTGGTATSGVIGLPTAATGWTVNCTDITTQSTSVFLTKQTASSTTTATITQYNDAATATAWAASDILHCTAAAY